MSTFTAGDLVIYQRSEQWARVVYKVTACEGDEVWLERLSDGRPAHAHAAELELASKWQ